MSAGRSARHPAFLRDNPEVREALRHYTRTTLEDQYAELIAAMGLTVEEKERFIHILASAQRRIVLVFWLLN